MKIWLVTGYTRVSAFSSLVVTQIRGGAFLSSPFQRFLRTCSARLALFFIARSTILYVAVRWDFLPFPCPPTTSVLYVANTNDLLILASACRDVAIFRTLSLLLLSYVTRSDWCMHPFFFFRFVVDLTGIHGYFPCSRQARVQRWVQPRHERVRFVQQNGPRHHRQGKPSTLSSDLSVEIVVLDVVTQFCHVLTKHWCSDQ